MAETEAEIHRGGEEEEEEEEIPTVVRIFVGGLGESVTDDDLRNIFSSSSRGLGKVETVEIIRTKGRSFAYMNFFPLSHNSLSRLFSTYNGCVWKGGKLRLEKAKEDYLSRLKNEWEEDAHLASLSSVAADDKVELPSLPTKDDLRDQKMVMFFPRLGKLKTLPLIGTGKHRYSFRRVDVPPLPKHFCDCEEHCDYSVVKKRNPGLEDGRDGLNEQEINLMNSVLNRLLQRESGGKPGTRPVDVEIAKDEQEQKEPAVEEVDDPVDRYEDVQVDDDTESDDDNIVLNIVGRKRKASSSTNKEAKDSAYPNKERNSLLNGENYVNESSPTVPQNSERSKSHSNGVELPPNVEKEKGIKRSTPSVSEKKRSSWKELVGNGSSTSFSISEILPGLESKKKKSRKSEDNAKSSRVDKKKLPRDEKSECQLDETELVGNDTNNQFSISELMKDAASNKKEQSNSDDIVQTSPDDKETLSRDEKSDAKLCNTELIGIGNSSTSSISEALTSAEISHKEETKSGDVVKLSDGNNNGPSRDEKSQLSDEEETLEDAENGKDVRNASTSGKTSGRGSAWLNKFSWTQLVSESNSSLFSISQILPGGAPEKQEPPSIADTVKAASPISSQVDDDKVEHVNTSEPVKHIDMEERNVEECAEIGEQSVADKKEESAPTSEEKPVVVTRQLVGETCSFMRSAASLKEWSKAKASLSGSRKRRKQ
ncbi:Protein REPRESSOR OF SILENCING 3 [Linum perenne]